MLLFRVLKFLNLVMYRVTCNSGCLGVELSISLLKRNFTYFGSSSVDDNMTVMSILLIVNDDIVRVILTIMIHLMSVQNFF